jgi:hypothetical protein
VERQNAPDHVTGKASDAIDIGFLYLVAVIRG